MEIRVRQTSNVLELLKTLAVSSKEVEYFIDYIDDYIYTNSYYEDCPCCVSDYPDDLIE